MSISSFRALLISDPTEAKRLILEALRKSEGDRKIAAEKLRVTHRSLYRFINRLGMWDEIDALIKKHSFPRVPGPPRSNDLVRVAVIKARGNLTKASAALECSIAELRAKIDDLNLWTDLNRSLRKAGCAELER